MKRENPFRTGTSYYHIYNVLSAHPQGVSREMLIDKVCKLTKKTTRHIGWDVSIVCSADQDGSAHPSVKSKSDIYYVQKLNNYYRLILRPINHPTPVLWEEFGGGK